MKVKTFDELISQVNENYKNGYETAVYSENNNRAVLYGSLISEEGELPDIVGNCELLEWNNENIKYALDGFEFISI